jgi:hypothetical protein
MEREGWVFFGALNVAKSHIIGTFQVAHNCPPFAVDDVQASNLWQSFFG